MADKNWLIALAAMSSLSLSIPTFAEYGPTGVYVGGQFGYGSTRYDRAKFMGIDSSEDGAAGRVYIGNQFSPYVALELGGTIFSYADLDKDYGDIKTLSLDLLFRVGLPIYCSGFRADIKAGATTIFTDLDPTPAGKKFGLTKFNQIETKPIVGASVNYFITPNIAVDLSYLHVFGTPKSENHNAPNIDLATVGISYLFITI